MVAIRSSGGPGRGVKLTWQGATVFAKVDAGVQSALDDLAKEIEATLHRELHRYPKHKEHQMADEAFAKVTVSGTKRTLSLGSDAPYTYWHEEGTSNFEGHPQIREIADRYAPQITPRLRAALGSQR